MKRTRRLLIFPPLAIIGAAAVLILSAATALACHNTVTGSTMCNKKAGRLVIYWTVTNSAPFFTETGSWTSSAGHSGSFTLGGGEAMTIKESVPGTQTGTDTITIDAVWQTRKGPKEGTATASITLTGTCQAPPPPKDLCKNLPGNQQTIPAGYLRAGANCYKIAPPPRDKKPHHHKKPVVSQPGAVVTAPPAVSVTVQQIADSGAGGG